MAGSATFFPSEADYLAALTTHYRSRFRGERLWRLLALIAVLTAAMALLIAVIDGDPFASLFTSVGGVIGGLGGIAGFMLVGRLMLPFWGRRLYRQQRTLHQEHEIAWDDAGVAWSTPKAQSRYDWGEFHRWRSGREVFMVYLNDHLFHFIPRRALTAESAADLETTLATHGPPPAS